MVQTNYFMYFNTYDLKYLSNKDWKIIVEFNNYIQKMTANIFIGDYIYIRCIFWEQESSVHYHWNICIGGIGQKGRKERKKENKNIVKIRAGGMHYFYLLMIVS